MERKEIEKRKIYVWFGPLSLLKEEKRSVRDILFSLLEAYFGIETVGIELKKLPSGKPYFSKNTEKLNINFNYSHSKTHFAIAFASAEVGIDLETNRTIERAEKLAERILCSDEMEAVKRKNTPLLAMWSRKEAVLKAHGMGIRKNLNSVNVSKSPAEIQGANAEKDILVYWQDLFLDKNLFACIASLNEFEEVEAHLLDGLSQLSYKSILPLSL